MAFFMGGYLCRVRKIEISGSAPILRNEFVPVLYRGGGGASSGLPGGASSGLPGGGASSGLPGGGASSGLPGGASSGLPGGGASSGLPGGGASSGLPGGTLAVRIFDFCIAMPVSCGADMAFIGKKIQKHNMVTATNILVLIGDRPRFTLGMMRRDRLRMSTLVFILHLLRNMKNMACPLLSRVIIVSYTVPGTCCPRNLLIYRRPSRA